MSADKFWISPKYTEQKLKAGTIEDKIDVFADQLHGWVFVHARALATSKYQFSQHAGFAILALVSAYFETIQAFLTGTESKNHSKAFFCAGVLQVFADLWNGCATAA